SRARHCRGPDSAGHQGRGSMGTGGGAAAGQAVGHSRSRHLLHRALRRRGGFLARPADPDHRNQRRKSAEQGYRAGQYRRGDLLADPRSAARRARDHELSAGHHPGRADLAAGSGRLLPAVDAVVRAQAGRPDPARRDRTQDRGVGRGGSLGRDPGYRRAAGIAGRDEPAGAGRTRKARPRPARTGGTGNRGKIRRGRGDVRPQPRRPSTARDEHHLRDHQGTRRHDFDSDGDGGQHEPRRRDGHCRRGAARHDLASEEAIMIRDVQVRSVADRRFAMPKAALVLLMTMLGGGGAEAAPRAPDLMQGDGRVSAFYAWDAAIPEPGRLLRQEKLEPTLGLEKAGAQYRILYSSTDGIDGKSPAVVSGLLFLPLGEPPAGGWPLLAWGHETAGMADICAPSWVGYSPRIEAFLNAWLARGMAVVATDYQGLGTVGPHPYMVVRPGAYGVL